MPATQKPVVFVGSSHRDLKALPEEVRDIFGFALFQAQLGGKHDAAKPLKGFGGAGVLEVVEAHDGDTYRAVYTVKFAGIVYVLHVFQKKSKQGVKTPQADIDLIKARLKRAQEDYEGRKADMTDDPTITRGSGNVFADLGLPEADEHMLKARIVAVLAQIIQERGLTQTAAAKRMGLEQPDVSKLLRGSFRGFSLERLLGFARALGSDVEITLTVGSGEEEGRLRLQVA